MKQIGFDAFQHHNWKQSEVLGTLTSYGGGIRGDTPLILMVKDESIPNDNRSVMCEQPSRKLHRTGCVQRYAPGDREEQ